MYDLCFSTITNLSRYCSSHSRCVKRKCSPAETIILTVTSGHTLVIPKKHYRTLDAMSAEDMARVGSVLPRISKAVTTACDTKDYNIMQNNGKQAGQVDATDPICLNRLRPYIDCFSIGRLPCPLSYHSAVSY